MSNTTRTAPALVLLLGLCALAAITLLQVRNQAGHDAQRELSNVSIELNQLQGAPFKAAKSTGGSPALARQLIEDGKARIARSLARLADDSPPAALAAVPALLRRDYVLIDHIAAVGARDGHYDRGADHLVGEMGLAFDAIKAKLREASHEYEQRADHAALQAVIGSAVAIVLLLLAFGFVHRRSVRARARAEALASENERLLAASRQEALTDSLTGLPNRRALQRDLDRAVARHDGELLLALFDLDGFKQYNDTFGHPAGDALLVRLSDGLRAAVQGAASAYRMGGDEFCVLVEVADGSAEESIWRAADALSEEGDAFHIGCSFGVARAPSEADDATEALRLADQRMYENKAGRLSASRQSADVLLRVLSERSATLKEQINGIGALAAQTAAKLELPEHEVKRIQLAAELHDVGKAAIPEAIIEKGGVLSAEEWAFMRNHTLIGERIVRAAPSLSHTAELVRSSHERYDGNGYPDGLAGDEIPIGAGIIAVCDAFDAMVSERPYRKAKTFPEALAELRRCAGSQFDPLVVAAFCPLVEDDLPATRAA